MKLAKVVNGCARLLVGSKDIYSLEKLVLF